MRFISVKADIYFQIQFSYEEYEKLKKHIEREQESSGDLIGVEDFIIKTLMDKIDSEI